MITVNLVCHAVDAKLEKTLQSVKEEECQIAVGTTNIDTSQRQTLSKYGADIFNFKKNTPNDEIRNFLIEKSDFRYNLWLNSGEVVKNFAVIKDAKKDDTNKIIIENKHLVKSEIRLWDKTKNYYFINPIFERLECPDAERLIKLKIDNSNAWFDLKSCENRLKEWMFQNRINSEPYYYQAFIDFYNNNLTSFKENIEKFLFLDQKQEKSFVYAKCYLSQYNLKINDFKNAIKDIIYCIARNPLMAEFWCVLGDIFYKLKKYQVASIYYNNAVQLGLYRNKYDGWSYETDKYQLYPQTMIGNKNA